MYRASGLRAWLDDKVCAGNLVCVDEAVGDNIFANVDGEINGDRLLSAPPLLHGSQADNGSTPLDCQFTAGRLIGIACGGTKTVPFSTLGETPGVVGLLAAGSSDLSLWWLGRAHCRPAPSTVKSLAVASMLTSESPDLKSDRAPPALPMHNKGGKWDRTRGTPDLTS